MRRPMVRGLLVGAPFLFLLACQSPAAPESSAQLPVGNALVQQRAVRATVLGKSWLIEDAAELERVAAEVAQPPSDAKLTLSDDGQIVLRQARRGRALDIGASKV